MIKSLSVFSCFVMLYNSLCFYLFIFSFMTIILSNQCLDCLNRHTIVKFNNSCFLKHWYLNILSYVKKYSVDTFLICLYISTLAMPQSKYSQLSLSRSWRDPLKLFEISVLWPTRFAELRKVPIKQPNFTNEHVIWLLWLEIYMLKILWKRGEIAPEEQFLLLSTIFCYLMLDFHVRTRVRFSLQDKRLFEITEVETMKVDCILKPKNLLWGELWFWDIKSLL